MSKLISDYHDFSFLMTLILGPLFILLFGIPVILTEQGAHISLIIIGAVFNLSVIIYIISKYRILSFIEDIFRSYLQM